VNLDAGRRLTCSLFDGGSVEIELEEQHSPDPSVGIFGEAGWWAFSIDQNQRELFMAEDGRVYEEDADDSFTHCIGVVEIVSVEHQVQETQLASYYDEKPAQN